MQANADPQTADVVLDLRLLIIPLVRVAQFLVSVYCLLIIVCPFVLILLAVIVLSVLDLRLRMTWHIQTFFSSDKLFPVSYQTDNTMAKRIRTNEQTMINKQ
jgi:hypothetical protein